MIVFLELAPQPPLALEVVLPNMSLMNSFGTDEGGGLLTGVFGTHLDISFNSQ